MVADSGANMKAALDKFENVLKFPCAAHLINLCVHDILKIKILKSKKINNSESYI